MCEKINGRRASAAVLHEDLADRLSGISLLLAAATTRLSRENHPVAAELRLAAEHLALSLAEIRSLARRSLPYPPLH